MAIVAGPRFVKFRRLSGRLVYHLEVPVHKTAFVLLILALHSPVLCASEGSDSESKDSKYVRYEVEKNDTGLIKVDQVSACTSGAPDSKKRHTCSFYMSYRRLIEHRLVGVTDKTWFWGWFPVKHKLDVIKTTEKPE